MLNIFTVFVVESRKEREAVSSVVGDVLVRGSAVDVSCSVVDVCGSVVDGGWAVGDVGRTAFDGYAT